MHLREIYLHQYGFLNRLGAYFRPRLTVDEPSSSVWLAQPTNLHYRPHFSQLTPQVLALLLADSERILRLVNSFELNT